MKISNISFCGFCDAFPESYRNNFTYEGKKALFDYLEEYEDSTGEEVEMDIIALCCEYSEYDNLSDYIRDYNTDIEQKDYTENSIFDVEEYDKAVLEEIQNKTTLINVEGSGFIIQCY